MTSALILFAHGSRDAAWASPFRVIQRKIAAQRPELTVELAFLEMMQPSLSTAVKDLVESGHGSIVVAPLFMAQGAHLNRDLSRLLSELRANHSDIAFTLLPPVGEVEAISDAMSNWLAQNS